MLETAKQVANTSARGIVKLVATQDVKMTAREVANTHVHQAAKELVEIPVAMAAHV